jgi:2-C-methyl-D-erythritol 2,4-cyclodiphosphate synthase
MRIGYGWDSHAFKPRVKLRLGGVTIPHKRGLAGNSDGDVLLHALTDALLGAIAAGDIGTHFPPKDKKWRGADSAIFVVEALRRVTKAGYRIANVDSTLILQEPRIVPHARKIRSRIAELLKLDASAVNVKAKTPEGMGTENAAIAHVVVLLVPMAADRRKNVRTEAVPTPEQIDSAVEGILKRAELLAKAGKKT